MAWNLKFQFLLQMVREEQSVGGLSYPAGNAIQFKLRLIFVFREMYAMKRQSQLLVTLLAGFPGHSESLVAGRAAFVDVSSVCRCGPTGLMEPVGTPCLWLVTREAPTPPLTHSSRRWLSTQLPFRPQLPASHE